MKREKPRPAFVPVEADWCWLSVWLMRIFGMMVILAAPISCLFWTEISVRVYICVSAVVSSTMFFILAGICANAAVTARNSAMQVQQLDLLLSKADQKEVDFREIDTEKPHDERLF